MADAGWRFTANFSMVGFHDGFGLNVTLPAIIGGQRAADLLYRGSTVRGEEATRMSLGDRLAGPGGQREVALTRAHRIAAAAPLAMMSIRDTQRAGSAYCVCAAFYRDLTEQARLWEMADCAEGIAASA